MAVEVVGGFSVVGETGDWAGEARGVWYIAMAWDGDEVLVDRYSLGICAGSAHKEWAIL